MNPLQEDRQETITMAHQAARDGELQTLRSLIDEKINSLDEIGRTLLHSAAHGGSVEVIEWLISNGFDVNARDNFGGSPLYEATYYEQKESIKVLKKHHAKLLIPNANKITAYIQFSIGTIALGAFLYFLIKWKFSFNAVMIMFFAFNILILSFFEGIKGLMGKRTFANNI